MVAWLALTIAAVRALRQAGTSFLPQLGTTALVQSGPYRFTRNPMYVALALFYLGTAIAFSLLWAIILLPVVLFIVQRNVIEREEQYLERKLGCSSKSLARYPSAGITYAG